MGSAPSILLELTASDSHLAILRPVMRELHQRGLPFVVYSDCEILRGRSDVAALEQEGVPYVRLAQEPLPGDDLEWELRAVKLRRQIQSDVERLRPALVVVLNDRNFPSLTFVEKARSLHIPTLLIQESMRKDLFQRPTLRKLAFRWRRKLLFGIEGGLRRYGQGRCEWYAAWGEMSAEYFRRVGVPDGRIVITGNPRFDAFASTDWGKVRQDAIRQLGLGPDQLALSFLSSPIEKMLLVSAEEKEASLRRFLGWAATLRSAPEWAGLRVMFKLHRGENPERFRALLREAGATDFAQVVEMGLYPLIAASSVLLMFSTTAGLEAALLARPIGILSLSKPLDDWDFVGRHVAATVGSRGALESLLRSARDNPAMGAEAKRAAHAYVEHVGEATRRVCDLIEAIYQKRAATAA